MASNDSTDTLPMAEAVEVVVVAAAAAAAAAAPAAAAAATTATSATAPSPPSAQKFTFYSNHGEIYFQTQPKPIITFHNPRAKKTDITCYPSTLRNLVNALPVAQSIAKKFIEDKDIIKFKDQEANSTVAAATKDQSLVYYKELVEYGDEIKMKLVLMVNVYNNKCNIWLKPMWKNPNIEAGTNPWFPTLRGFQFSIYDDADEIMSFIDRHHSAWAAAEHDRIKVSADAF
jgi:hypothetical protein